MMLLFTYCVVQALQGDQAVVEQHEETLELLEGTNPKADWQVSTSPSRQCQMTEDNLDISA